MDELGIREFTNKLLEGQRVFENLKINPSFDSPIGYYDKNDFMTINPNVIRNEKEYLSFVNCEFNVNFYISDLELFGSSEPFFLKNSVFNKDVSFFRCIFNEDFTFEDIDFNAKCFVDSCSFKGTVCFNNVTFFKKVTFNYNRTTGPTIFEDNVYFNSAFKGLTYFDKTIFRNVDFRGSTFGSENITFNSCSFELIALFRELNLGNNIHFNDCELTNCSFSKSFFENTRFENCDLQLGKLLDERILNGELDKPTIDALNSYGIHSSIDLFIDYDNIINTYRQFEINFDNYKDYELAGEIHKRRYDLQKNAEKNRVKKVFITFYKWFSNYGEDYTKSLFWIVGILVGFSFVYLFTGIKYDEAVIYWGKAGNTYSRINDLCSAFLYSLNSSVPFRREIEHLKSASGFTSFFL